MASCIDTRTAQYQASRVMSRHRDNVRTSTTTMSSNSTPLTLQSLQRYAVRQEELIESLLDTAPDYFQNPDLKVWTTFWESAWGKGAALERESVVRDPKRISDSLIPPDVVPPYCDGILKPKSLDDFWGGFGCKKFLIRHEYKEAEEFVCSVFSEEGMFSAAIVTGQTAIGLPPLLNHSGILGSFFREIGLPAFHALEPSRAPASHCATGRSREAHTLLPKGCEGAYAAKHRVCLRLTHVLGPPSCQDLGPCGHQFGFARTCSSPHSRSLLRCRNGISL